MLWQALVAKRYLNIKQIEIDSKFYSRIAVRLPLT